MRYPDHLKEDIRSRVDIVEFVGRYVPLKKSGASFKGLCPFHQEKTPSFTVTPSRNIFHCFGCSKGGDVFAFLMEMEHLGFAEAFTVLAKEAGIDLTRYKTQAGPGQDESNPIFRANQLALEFFHDSLKKSRRGRTYFEQRGITQETVNLFKLGYAPAGWENLLRAAVDKGIPDRDLFRTGLVVAKEGTQQYYDRFRDRIMFPIYNLSGLPVGFGGRIMESDSKGAKYINSPETEVYKKSAVLYGLHLTRPHIREKKAAVLVEGYMDFHALFQSGIRHVIASSGTALTAEQAHIIRRYAEKAYVVFDADAAGVKAADRGIEVLARAGLEVGIVVLPKGTDPDSFVKDQGADVFNTMLDQSLGFVEFKLRLAMKKYGTVTPEAKAKVATEIAQSLIAIQNEIVREEYAKQVAARLHVDLASIHRAVAGAARRTFSARPSDEVVESASPTDEHAIEKDVLGLLIANPHLAEKAADLQENQELWDHPSMKAFLDRILGYIRAQGQTVDFQQGLSHFTPREQRFVLRIISQEQELNSSEQWDTAVHRLRMKYCNRRIGEIRSQMQESGADKEGLARQVNEIMKKKAELEKQDRLKKFENSAEAN